MGASNGILDNPINLMANAYLKPKPSEVSLLIILLVVIGYCAFPLKQPIKGSIRPLVKEDSLYLESKSVNPITIEVNVLGSISNPIIRSLATCESGLNPSAVNMKDVHRNKDGTISIGSFGLLMYGVPTWENECVKRFGIEDDIYNPKLQIQCTELLLGAGESYRWKNCWRIINN